MTKRYYKPCKELDRCNELIDKYFLTKQYDKCFIGHLELAQIGYPLAECQVGYFYLNGLGVEKDLDKAFYWTKKAAEHGDIDAMINLASFYKDGIGAQIDLYKATYWQDKANDLEEQ